MARRKKTGDRGEAAAAACASDAENPFLGKLFAATGSFFFGGKAEVQVSVEPRGAVFKDELTKGTHDLVVGEGATASIVDRAKAQGTTIIDDRVFWAMRDRVPLTPEMIKAYLG